MGFGYCTTAEHRKRSRPWETYVATLKIAVWSTETGQRVDEKDFMDKNFAR